MKRAAAKEIRGPGGVLHVRPDDEAALDLLMLIEGETSGRSLDEVLQEHGRSRSTYYEKLRRFREGGVEALLSRPPGPRSPWRRPLEVVRFIVTTRLRHPARSAGAIAEELSRAGHAVSARSVERTLSQFGLTRSTTRAVTAVPHVMAAAPSLVATPPDVLAPPNVLAAAASVLASPALPDEPGAPGGASPAVA